MCDDHVEMWTEKEVTARKWRYCDECGGVIAPRDRYVRHSYFFDGAFTSCNVHVACESVAKTEDAKSDGCRVFGQAQEMLWNYTCNDADVRLSLAVLRWMRIATRRRFAKEFSRGFEEVKP
jgi:hypothetical protein